MKLQLRTKKAKVTLAGIHQPSIAPERDWLLLLGLFAGFILLSTILSSLLFISVYDDDMSYISEGSETLLVINRAALDNAIEFINSRQ